MAMVNPMVNLVNVKDSRWLTLEVCREFQRNKCTRTELECKFAHPPPHVEVQNGRVTCCFDSIKGKCQRKDPPCKYLHPPQHLKEQLLQNGRNNLILKNLQMQALAAGALQPLVPGMVPVSEATSHHAPYPRLAQNMPGFQQYGLTMYDPASASNKALSYPTHTVLPSQYQILQANPYLGVPNPALNPYLMPSVVTGAVPGAIAPVETGTPVSGAATAVTPVSVVPSPGVGAATATTQKITRPDRLESTNSSNGGEPAWTYADSIAQSSQYSHLYFQPQVVEVLTGAGKKRPRDPADDLVLQGMTAMPGMVPYVKRPAVADGKSGVPVYQPGTGTTAYQQALAAMQMQQQSFVPAVTMSSTPSAKVTQVTMATPAPAPIPANAASVKYFDEANQLLDSLPVCRDFKAGQCVRPQCKYVHLVQDYVEVSDGKVTVCRDAAKGKCLRPLCKYYHIPAFPKLII